MFWHLVIILIVLIIIVIIWWAIKKSRQNIKQPQVIFPSQKYMEEIGGKCPDYWTYLGDNEINNTKHSFCENTYKLPVRDKNTCLIGNDVSDNIRVKSNLISFPAYKKWPPTNTALTDRCNWISKCGPQQGMHASWVGMEKICSQQAK